MATKIRGITIELGADYSQVTDAFKKVTKELNATTKSLKDVDKLLKLDPSNVELLTQKQGYLEDAISQTAQKLLEEKQILENMPSGENGEQTEQQKALAREIEATSLQLQKYQGELDATKTALNGTQTATEQAEQSTEELVNTAEKGSDKLSKLSEAFTGLNQGLELMKKGFGMVKGVYDEFIGGTVSMADELMQTATITGLSTDALQEYSFMAELVDTDVSTITGSLAKLTKNMGSAKDGTGASAEAFKQLGVSVTDSNGELRGTDEVFNEIIDALGQMSNETERDALAMDIFGKSAMELNPLISAGSEAIEEYKNQAHEMGYVLDNETLEALGGVDDTMQLLTNQFNAVKQQIGVALMPVVEEITKAFLDWATSVDWVEVGNTIKKVVNVIVAVIKTLIPVVKTIIDVVSTVVGKLIDFFTMKWEIPKIKLPHFSISPRGWKISDLLKGSIPKLSIEWYAKAMENGMVLDGATIFGMNKNGQLMGGGERGREVIIGEDKFKQMTSNQISIVINESANPEATAKAVMNKLQLAMASEGRVWR